jgi:RHS repeat-associated protein
MSSRFQYGRILALIAAFAALSSGARAAMLDQGNEDRLVALGVSMVGESPTGNYSMAVQIGGPGTLTGVTGSNGNPATPVYAPPGVASLNPEIVYQVTVTSSNFASWSLTFAPPSGFQVYIDGAQANGVTATGAEIAAGTALFQVCLHSVGFGGAAGVPSRITANPFYFSIGLGNLSTGLTAGAVSVMGSTRQLIGCPEYSTEVQTQNDSGGLLKTVLTPQTFVFATDVTGGFELDFYPASDAGPIVNNLYTVKSGSTPYMSYQVTAPSTTSGSEIQVTRYVGGGAPSSSNTVTITTVTTSGTTYTMNEYGATTATLLRTVTLTNVLNSPFRTETATTTYPNASQPSSEATRTYETFSWSGTTGPSTEVLIKEVDDFGDATHQNYTTTYNFNPANGQLISVVYPTGNWVAYDYYSNQAELRFGQIMHEYHPWLGEPASPPALPTTSGDVYTYDYANDWMLGAGGVVPASTIEAVNGTTVGQETIANSYVQLPVNPPSQSIWMTSITDYTSSGASVGSVGRAFAPNASTCFLGLESSQTNTDGSMKSYGVIPGTLTLPNSFSPATSQSGPSGPDLELICLHGLAKSATGATQFSTIANAAIDAIWLLPNQSTETIQYLKSGLLMREENYVYTGVSGTPFSLLGFTTYTYTPSGKVSSSTSSSGATTSEGYVDEFLTSSTDTMGIVTNYVPDGLQRVSQSSKQPGPGYSGPTGASAPTGAITTTYTYDSDDNVIGTQVAGGGLALTSGATYNLCGRVTSRTDVNGLVTSYAYQQGGLIQTISYPGGATQTSTAYLEGRMQSVTGSAQVATYSTYTLDSAAGFVGFISAKTNFGTSSSGNWTLTENNWMGQKVKDEKANTLGSSVETDQTYNNLGQLIKSSTTGIAPTQYYYTPMGALEVTDFGSNTLNTPAFGGPDRVDQSDTVFTQDISGNWWATTTNLSYAGTSSSTATTIGTVSVRHSGFSGGVQSEVKNTDIDGNISDKIVTVNPATSTVTTSTTTTGISNAATSVAYDGLLIQKTTVAGVTTTYGYDALGRTSTVTDPRKGSLNTSYFQNVSQVQQMSTVVTGGTSIVAYTYDSAGRLLTKKDPGGNVTTYAYDSMNSLTGTSVNGIQTVQYNYSGDPFERLQSQVTFFGSSSSPSTTTFGYYGDTAFVHTKTDPSNNALVYAYDGLNRLSTTTDGRGAVTALAYDPVTGYLSSRTYSGIANLTPNVTFTYNRNGSPNTVADTFSGLRTFAYGADLQLKQEQLPSFFGANRTVTYVPDTGNVMGRLTDVELGNISTPAADQDTHYTYNTTDGRLHTAAANGNGFTNYSFTYTYTPNSDQLVSNVANTSSGYSRSLTYDPNRDLILNHSTSYGATTAAGFAYTYNLSGQKSVATESGSAFSGYGASPVTNYVYDQFGQIDTALMSLSGTSMSGRQYAYTFDTAGNRLTASHTGALSSLAESYTPNNLNQIASKENTTVPVQGTVASTAAKVVVQSTLAGQALNYWGSEALLYNADGGNGVPALGPIPIYAGLKGGGPKGADVAAQTSVTAFIGPLFEVPTYDQGGNLTSDGRWTYTWDNENQLTQIETNAAAQRAGLADTRVKFAYDYLGRRIQKQIFVNGSSTSLTTYVYFGWDVMAELNSSGSVLRHFIWGVGANGSMSGTSGVGGLLMIQDSGHTYMPAFDGNGNVAALLDASAGGAIAAKYEYSPFGELLQKSGSYAASNPFRWSTKWTDDETALVYYGHRYYDPRQGRFISRDPIGEAGGLNLYGFCGNDGINQTDLLGFDPTILDPYEVIEGRLPITNYSSLFDAQGYSYFSGTDSIFWRNYPPTVAALVLPFPPQIRPGKGNPSPKGVVGRLSKAGAAAAIDYLKWARSTGDPEIMEQALATLFGVTGVAPNSAASNASTNLVTGTLSELWNEFKNLSQQEKQFVKTNVVDPLVSAQNQLLDAVEYAGDQIEPGMGSGARNVAFVGAIALSDGASAEAELAAEGAGGNFLVYQSVNEAGEVQYVGITSDFGAREAAHLAGENGSGLSYQITRIPGLDNLSLGDARAAEQTLIDSFGLGENGGTLLNRINSISPTNDPEFYINSQFRGQELLKGAGYKLPGP